jgi:hypothetical protein
MLREAGLVGIKNYEFPQHFILNYKARLDELREKGFDIKTIRVDGSVWKYVLNEPGMVKKESWQSKRKKEAIIEMENLGQERLIK